jgi:hypothetical protein
MPAAHINQWKHNREFIGHIDPGFPDWAVTVVFYAALHAVDSLLKHDKVLGVVSHDARNRTLMLTNRYAKIWELYQPLFNLSRTVRYLANPAKWVAWGSIENQVIRRYLYGLESSVQGLMKTTLDLPPIVLKVPPQSLRSDPC